MLFSPFMIESNHAIRNSRCDKEYRTEVSVTGKQSSYFGPLYSFPCIIQQFKESIYHILNNTETEATNEKYTSKQWICSGILNWDIDIQRNIHVPSYRIAFQAQQTMQSTNYTPNNTVRSTDSNASDIANQKNLLYLFSRLLKDGVQINHHISYINHLHTISLLCILSLFQTCWTSATATVSYEAWLG